MIAWYVASVPFWLCGAFFFFAVCYQFAKMDTHTEEITANDKSRMNNAMFGMLVCMVCLLAGAIVVTIGGKIT